MLINAMWIADNEANYQSAECVGTTQILFSCLFAVVSLANFVCS